MLIGDRLIYVHINQQNIIECARKTSLKYLEIIAQSKKKLRSHFNEAAKLLVFPVQTVAL